ncbi:MAG: serine acetyltransferase [Cellvibrionaceae bacterium]|jgi:serine acetyltransferase
MDILDIFADIIAVLRARFYLRKTKLGRKVRVNGKPIINSHGQIIIADRCRLVATMGGLELGAGTDGTLEIGESTFINYGTSIVAMQHVRIGKDCNIGTYCMIMDNDFHRLEPERRNERPKSEPIIIGDNVWLGGKVIVLKGVTIGDGSVIAAGSIVTKDIPARSLAAGSPARVIRQL